LKNKQRVGGGPSVPWCGSAQTRRETSDESRKPPRLIARARKRSVAEFLPNFETNVRKALRELLGEEGEKRIKMGMAKDGSGVGGEREIFFLDSIRLGRGADCP
jgi:hypothetical protein